MNEKIESLIKEAIQDLTEQQDAPMLVALDGDTPLYGKNGLLDSVGLVSLVVAVEQAIEDEFDVMVPVNKALEIKTLEELYRTVANMDDFLKGSE